MHARRRLGLPVWVGMVLAFLLATTTPGHALAAPLSQTDDAASLYVSLTNVLEPGTNRATERVPGVALGPDGEATVIFAIRSQADNGRATRAAAIADTLTLLHTLYGSAVAPRITSATVLGTFPFKSTKGRAIREGPVLRAVLSAEHAARLNWADLTPAVLASVLDDWWMQAAFANVDEPPADAVADQRRGPLDLAAAHAQEVVQSLTAGDVRVARSQLKQFFDAWDEVDAQVSQQFPLEYQRVDGYLERAEIALLHSQPEDVPGARAAMVSLTSELSLLEDQLAR